MPSDNPGGTKERLFMAAVRVFAAKGYKGATVRDICREADGANLNAVTYYFGGKENLYQAILEVLFSEGNRRMEAGLTEAADMAPEKRLRLLLEVCCQLLFAGGEAGEAFLRLWAMELANPTPFLGDMVRRHSVPQTEAVLQTIAGIVGQDTPREVLISCMMSVIGPTVYQALVWPTLREVFPDHPNMAEYWPRLVDHLYCFAMAGLMAVREAIAEERHGKGVEFE